MTDPVRKCQCVGQHVPEAHALATHHVLPLSWGGPNVPENKITLCPTTHENVHRLLNAYVKARDVPPWTVRRKYSDYVRRLASEAWMKRPSDTPPYTVQQHAYEENSG